MAITDGGKALKHVINEPSRADVIKQNAVLIKQNEVIIKHLDYQSKTLYAILQTMQSGGPQVPPDVKAA